MTVTAARVSVGTTPTLLLRADADGQYLNVRNPDAAVTFVIGGSTVTALNGYTLAPATALTLELGAGEAIYGIVAAGTATAHVLSTRGS